VKYLIPAPAEFVIERSVPLFEARKRAIDRATQRLSLVLDADTIIPSEFLTSAMKKLQQGYAACTLRYANNIQDHPPFGASLWLTDTLKSLYDYDGYVREYKPVYQRTEDERGNDYYNITNPFLCECLYMYAKLQKHELYVFDDLLAEHIKRLRKSYLYS
jgi:hypothetical protein